ncbi:MAG: TetR/AcrR family transcriptional regulator [Endomicrobiales bacterium]|nr:TetR/AcrR family transcriptional regulator [Endomicrobiales bacterium]
MTRPSQNIDKKLIAAGKELIPLMGISGLKIREVTKKAGANLGMFNYHFGTKEKYIEVLMIDVYSKFLSDFKLDSEKGSTSQECLRNTLIGAAHFIRQNRTLIAALFEEILKGNIRIVEFARKNMTKHINILLKLIKQCQKDGYLIKTSIFVIAPILIGAVALPSIAIRVLEKNYQKTVLGTLIPLLKNTAISDKRITERIDYALKGLQGERKK